MKKSISHFPQHPLDPWKPTMETCGAACVLMLLDFYESISYPTPKMEHTLYYRYRVNGYKGMTGAAVARCLSNPKEALSKYLSATQKTLDVHLVQSFAERMDNRGGFFPQEEYEKIADSHEMHLAACKNRIRLSTGLEFDTEFLKQQLTDGKKIILEICIPEVEEGPASVLHWVIVESYDADCETFCIRDPKPKTVPIHLKAEALEAYMKTPIGRICIITGEKD